MEYIDFSAGQAGSQEAAEELATNGAQPVQQHYAHVAASYAAGDPPKPPYLNPNFPAPISCDIKPRLTKEQHDILEAHFQKQNKPNTNTKKTFAESLNVSLDKVNNWFQNRRAKLKQDAKKQQGSLNLFHGHQHASSDGETSPAYVDTTSQYHAMMQHLAAEQRAANGLGISQMQHGREQLSPHGLSFQGVETGAVPFNAYNGAVQFYQEMFNSQDELNRRTLTQEQFDAMERDGGMTNGFGTFEDFETTFNGNHALMNTIFPDYNGDFKQQQQQGSLDHYPIGAPMTSYDSTIPSNVSAESLPMFPSSTQMQSYANMSANSSDWSDSRSSSIHETVTSHTPIQHQPTAATSQWQPGQSVPVDANQQQEEFRQVAAARASHARTSPQQPLHEQSLPWSDDSMARRGSSASLVQSMGDVGIQTPPQHQNGTFKSPAPPSNIAARRQRPRPAALGVAALRSQSHCGAIQTGPPGHVQHQQFHPTDPQLRRIRSSNWLGNVAHGRVMKSTPGSAQRSPMSYTFADAINSPHALRHMSAQGHSSLAPPTPLSPKESSEMEEAGPLQHNFQTTMGNAGRQASITETEVEHAQSYHPMAGFHGQSWTSSPPHTPMYHQHPLVQSRFNGHTIMENTPPQSAPAAQTCFPSGIFTMPQPPQHHVQSQPVPSQPAVQQHAPVMTVPQTQPQFTNPAVPEQQFPMSNVAFAPPQSTSMPPAAAPPALPIHFANGVPITNADGNIEMLFPSAAQFLQQPQSQGHTPPQHMHTPPQVTYSFVASAGGSPSSQSTTQLSKSSSDFFVHEYSPPESVKRAATPRKGPVDTVPKNYAFANTGPEHFEEKKSDDKKGKKSESKDSASSSSPASSNGAAIILIL